MEPFLKWPGGKRWLANRNIVSLEPSTRWIEPFAGSAAMFFSLEPNSAVLADANWELINAYQIVRDDLQSFLSELEILKNKTSSSDYYNIRKSAPNSNAGKAARFLYLNRLSWNGLYRVNKKGEFNVPRGTKNSVFLSTDNWEMSSKILQRAELRHCDFETVVDQCGADDCLFVDPPYTVAHNANGFIKYNENIFSWHDQIRLKNALKKAANRGANIIMTNADHSSIHELYEENRIQILSRSSVMAGKSSARGRTSEALILIPPGITA